ncbi:hypothetical protein DPMN_170482 [Dreissena polymorpha]|uniref:Uncharacterized protein n=1 Tax=Dreissena polymorpha TaxID=45954 RepID=A0A9D4IEM3_DREPO|nr:hypothetical protein DPMN_170482 [Dreissena polymorpha]
MALRYQITTKATREIAHLRYKWTDLFCATQDIIRTNVLTKFHQEVLTRINSPPPGGHFHEDWTINVTQEKNAPPPTESILELFQDIIDTNLLTKFHEDRTFNVASRVLTSHIMKNALPPGGHVFQATIFELFQDIIGTNLLTKKNKCDF